MSILYEEQQQALERTELAFDILKEARNELYLNLRFLDVALSSLSFLPDGQIRVTGTDGRILYVQPDGVFASFRRGRAEVNRRYLHSVLHCLFSHLWTQGGREEAQWDLACDVAVEYVMDGLLQKAVHRPKPMLRREFYRQLEEEAQVLTAQRIYRQLLTLEEAQRELLRAEFTCDDHSRWSRQPDQRSAEAQKRWEDLRERMQTELETFGKEEAGGAQSLEEQVRALNRSRYDYRKFLRKFTVQREELQVDPDSFDYIFYHYGMELYGNMPLMEPLETKEVQKIEDFVIVLDTSMSCKGELLLRFLQETYRILSESESFFRKIHVHILQCDDRVQEDVLITNREEMQEYLEHFTVRGFGGTDFRPAFARVRELLARGCFARLRGLLYFTDGYGTFPVKKPPYETAFVFLREDYRDVDVPPWAIRLILDREELEGYGTDREAG